MAYQLGAKPLPKPMMTLPEGANLCGISINFCTVCAAVSIILMTYPVISKHFRYFFQFLQIQVEETYFFHEVIVNLWFWTYIQKYNWKEFVFCPFLWLFYLFIHFQSFSYFSSFFRFRWKKPISSRNPSQFPSSNTTVKYWYSAHFCCCFISLENYNFLQGKILHIYPFQTFWKILSQSLPLQVEKPISSREPSQFLVSLPMEGTCKQQ